MTYKPVVSSSLINLNSDTTDAFSKNFSDYSLKTGIVVKVYPTDDPNNYNKLCIEYDVLTISQDKDAGSSSVIYKKCTCLETFGNVGDFMEFTLRTPEKNLEKEAAPEKENGATVLLLCANGQQDKGIIIGSLRHANRKTTLESSSEHHLEGEFNGIRYKVDKDGAFSVVQKTKTDAEGKPKSTSAAGSSISIDLEGSIEINDAPLDSKLAKSNAIPKGKEEAAVEESASDDIEYEKFKIDRTNKKIQIEARDNIEISTDNNLKITAKENADIQLKKDLLLMAEGKAKIEIKKEIGIEAGTKVELKSKDFIATFDNLMMVKSKQYLMQAETAILNNQQTIIGPSPLPALTLQTFYLGVGFGGVPVISVAIGPFSSTVLISA